MTARPAVFLDRDGTINREVHFLSDPEQVQLLPRAAGALRSLGAAGFRLVVITNQSGIARGYFDEERLATIHTRLSDLLAAEGVTLDGFYVCPHHPAAPLAEFRVSCDCRKPRPGLFARAIDELDIMRERSFAIGDSARDLAAPASLGVPGILVATGKGREEHARLAREGRAPTVYATDLGAAADWILSRTRTETG